MINLEFENNYQQKIMTQTFSKGSSIKGKPDILAWRKAWMDGLKTWHSPYKLVLDCRHLSITNQELFNNELPDIIKFFKGFFLRKVVVITTESMTKSFTTLECFLSESEAYAAVGLREFRPRIKGDFRSSIQFQNHFRQHSIELSFSDPVSIDDKEKLQTLRSKLTNNLMHWHSAWNLLVDCSQLTIAESMHDDFKGMIKFFQGFFLKQIVGYSPKSSKDSYPFEVFRARHRAAAKLENEGAFSGEDANCSSRKMIHPASGITDRNQE